MDEARDEAAETMPTHPTRYARAFLKHRSLIPVFKILSAEPYFDDLVSNYKESEKQDRLETLVFPIMDEELERKSEQAHAILNAFRMYLRVFHYESALVSEVYQATIILETTYVLAIGNFP